MPDYLTDKSIIITGAGGGFGKLTSEKAAGFGASITCADINLDAAEAVASGIRAAGGKAQAVAADVANIDDMRQVARQAVATYGRIDVMINNAGIMPLAFLSDHEVAIDAWSKCIDINFKGVMNGVAAVFDQMIAQGQGHVVNLSSIFGNRPAAGGAIYGATKAAVDYFSHAVRQEGRGKIKVTVIKPTGVPATGLGASVINHEAAAGILGHNVAAFYEAYGQQAGGTLPAEWENPESINYWALGPEHIADAIIYAIDQPWGVSISDVTVRAAGDFYVL